MTDPEPDEQRRAVDRAGGFALFAEMGVVSILAFMASAFVVPWVAGLAAGIAHMRRHLSGLGDSIGDYGSLWWQAFRGGWSVGLASVAVWVALSFNSLLLSAGAVPGGRPVEWVMIAIGVAAWVVGVRAAALWSTPEGEGRDATTRQWWGLVAQGARVAIDDLLGSAVLVGAFALGAVLVWLFLPVAIAVPGLWVMAAVVVEVRRRGRTAHPDTV